MKIIITIFLILFTQFLFSQQLSVLDKQKIQKINNTTEDYVGEKLKNLLQDLPEIKMVRIMPNNPDKNTHTFIFGFIDNQGFSRNKNSERVTLFVKGNLHFDNLIKEDISTKEAIKKYGNLEIVAVLKR